jgi:ribosome-associated protein
MPATHPSPREPAVAERPSKTQLKQQMLSLQRLGQQVTELPAERLAAVQLPERLRDAIAEYKRTRSHEGRRRQLQYIGKLMRTVDAEPLQAAVDAFALGSAVDSLQLHEAERWRLELVNDDDALARWGRTFPDSDLQQLSSFVRAARRDAALPPPQRHGRSWRELFQFVKPFVARACTS